MVEEKEAKTNGVLTGDLINLKTGLEILGKLKLKNFKLNYAIEYNIEKVNRGMKAYFKTLEAMREVSIEQDERGESKTYASGIDYSGQPMRKFVFKSPEQKKKFNKEAEELDAKPFEEKIHGIKVSTLEAEKNPGIDASVMVQISCILVRDVKIPDAI